MSEKDEILAAIATLGTSVITDLAALGTRLETRIDVMANGIGRIEADVAQLRVDVAQLRVDVAANRMESNARLTALEAKLS